VELFGTSCVLSHLGDLVDPLGQGIAVGFPCHNPTLG
jgi:hypothetical protein